MPRRRQRRLDRPVGPLVRGSVVVGRKPVFASRNPLLLPRRYATALSTGRQQWDDLRSLRARFRLREATALPVVKQVQRRQRQLVSLVRPFFSERSSPCVRRSERKQVMFAKEIAGRRWGSGGPIMKDARRTVESAYQCRR